MPASIAYKIRHLKAGGDVTFDLAPYSTKEAVNYSLAVYEGLEPIARIGQGIPDIRGACLLTVKRVFIKSGFTSGPFRVRYDSKIARRLTVVNVNNFQSSSFEVLQTTESV